MSNFGRRAVLLSLMAPCTGIAAPVRIGYLGSGPDSKKRKTAFTAGLEAAGFKDGHDAQIEWQFAAGKYDTLHRSAEQLVQSAPRVIVASGAPAVSAARQQSTRIPIVMVDVGNPSAFVRNLARPESNITGIGNGLGDVVAKHLELLVLARPDATRVAVLWNPRNPLHERRVQQLSRPGIELIRLAAPTAEDLAPALDDAVRKKASAMMFVPDFLYVQHGTTIAQLAMARRLPAIFLSADPLVAGGLMSYGSDEAAQHRQAALYVAKLLRGARPGDLPVEISSRYELVLNQVVAARLGIRFPEALLVRADRVLD